MQTESEQVMHSLAGWPQCWSCLDYQKPHRSRMAAMRKYGMDTCLCTPCRTAEVRCARCYDVKARWAMLWRPRLEDGPMPDWKAHLATVTPFAYQGAWEGFCASCARILHKAELSHLPCKSTQFYAYPAGTPRSVPRARWTGGRRNRTQRP